MVESKLVYIAFIRATPDELRRGLIETRRFAADSIFGWATCRQR
jgi:hypothetical protein